MKKLFLILVIGLLSVPLLAQQKYYGIDIVNSSVWDVNAVENSYLPVTIKSCYTTYYQFDVISIDTSGYGASLTIQGSLDGDFYQNTGMSFAIDSTSTDTILVDTLCFPKVRVVLDTGSVTSGIITLYMWLLRID